MNDHLVPCPACARHVRAASARCPFCATALDHAFQRTSARAMPAVRLGRAATYAFGAALAVSACGPSSSTTGGGGGGGGTGIVQPYGAPPDPRPPEIPTPPPPPPIPEVPVPPTPPEVPEPPATPEAPEPPRDHAPTKTAPHHTHHDPGAPASGYGAAPLPSTEHL